MTEAPPAIGRPAFAHASEAELARILDFYAVRWAYEPDTFPIAWNLDGEVIESFSPDFYLPDFELYVELTTLKQKLVRKKNRKLRRLRELYPGIRIKLFYARDFRMLLLKFGRLALLDELSGTTGQATPPRAVTGATLPHLDGQDALAAPARDEAGELDAGEVDPNRADTADGLVGGRTSREGRGRRRGKRRRRAASQTAPGAPAGVAGPDPGARHA